MRVKQEEELSSPLDEYFCKGMDTSGPAAWAKVLQDMTSGSLPDVGQLNTREGAREEKWVSFDLRTVKFPSTQTSSVRRATLIQNFEADFIRAMGIISPSAALYAQAVIAGVQQDLPVYRRRDVETTTKDWTMKLPEEQWHSPVLRMHSDKVKEFLAKSVRSLLKAHGIRQTTNSGYDPAANGIAERWVGIVKVRATALLAEHRLPPDYWAYACRWVAYIHNHRVLNIRLNASYPLFGDVVVVHRFLKKPPSFEDRGVTGVCLGHNPLVLTVGTITEGLFNVIVTAKVRKLGEASSEMETAHSSHRPESGSICAKRW